MPDPPPEKRTYPLPLARGARGAAPAVAYAELHAKTNFTFGSKKTLVHTRPQLQLLITYEFG